MAKNQDEHPAASQPADIDRSDTTRHADEKARQQAIEKMKATQAKMAKQTESQGDDAMDKGEFGDDNKQVTESEIDPKAKKALQDLLGRTSEDANELSKVKVYSPFRIYYDSHASSVSAVNGTGPFDILPGHKNFLTLLSPGDIVVRSKSGKEETIGIDRGVMHVHGNEVKVFLDV